jgi:hypothetical protein
MLAAIASAAGSRAFTQLAASGTRPAVPVATRVRWLILAKRAVGGWPSPRQAAS